MLQTNHTSTDRPAKDLLAEPTAQADHAFPMLDAESLAVPPFFRFMWGAR